MATAKRPAAAAKRRPVPASQQIKLYKWTGKNQAGKVVSGDIRATNEGAVRSNLRRQSITVTKIKQAPMSKGRKITEKDIAIFIRQLAVMLRSGVPLIQALEISIRGTNNPSFAQMLSDMKTDIEQGSSLSEAASHHPAHFDTLFVNLVAAGEQAGILDDLLERLAAYKEKMLAIKSKIKSAMFYPAAIMIVAVVVVAVLMIWVIPSFKEVFSNFGADLPGPTLMVIGISDFFVEHAFLIFGGLIALIAAIIYTYRRSEGMQEFIDRTLLKLPILGDVIRKACVARWARTLSTMFAAGVPLVEALESVGGAAGNRVYVHATKAVRSDVAMGVSLNVAMHNTEAFPVMVTQMTAIGEESGQLDSMLSKVADFFEQEVDDAVAALSTLLEPIIMVILGVIIGGLIVAMYLPIFKLGAAIG